MLPSPLIAASGLILIGFLLLHLAGSSLALTEPARFEAFATWLHHQLWLPMAELALVLLLSLHPLLALGRWIANRVRAGTQPLLRRSRRQGPLEPLAAAAGRWQPFSGGLLLLFLALHLRQLRWHRPGDGQELERLLSALGHPTALVLYALAGLALGLHLLHGTESAHRSLGLLNGDNRPAIRWLGRILALVLGAGFTLLPLALALQAMAASGTGASA